MREMWAFLDTYTTSGNNERAVNHLNEWGGFSRRLGMPVFTGWSDLLQFNQTTRETRATILAADWSNGAGRSNQEKWITYAEANGGDAAFFIVFARDVRAEPRKVESFDTERVFVGTLAREAGDVYIVGKPRSLL
jgi:hypothetical protein